MVERRWRKVEGGWQFEELSVDGVDGDWTPLAAVWKYAYGIGDRIPPLTMGEEARGQ